MGKIPRKKIRLRRGLAAFALAAAISPVLFISGSSAAVAPVGQGFTVTPSDLAFILKQIKIAEHHAATATPTNLCGTLVGPGPDQIPDRLTSYGLRTVDGSCNNLFPARDKFAASDVPFPRLTTPNFRPAEDVPPGFGPPGPPVSTSYAQKKGLVFDSQPRLISNLIVDQTSTNPAAVAAAEFPVRTQGNPGLFPCTTDPDPTALPDPIVGVPAGCVPSHKTLFIPNVTTDVGLSPPYNSLFTFFGQFFDHGVDQTVKGGGTVFVPLKSDDPLIAGPDHILGNADDLAPNLRFMVLTRAQNQPGPDGILGDRAPTNSGPPTTCVSLNNPAGCDESADDVQDANNTDTPWVDQSQTYTSHSSHQVFLREYVMNAANRPVSTGKLLGGLPVNGTYPGSPDGQTGISTWASTKKQAAEKLGLKLVDKDVTNIPMIAADPYGKFIPDAVTGLPDYVTTTGLVSGDLANPVAVPANVLHFDTPFLTDIAHNADPGTVGPCTTAIGVTPRVPAGCLSPDADTSPSADFANQPAGTYDDEMLDAHFTCGDGRCNENIALSTIHQVFHSEHDRLVDYVKNVLTTDTTPSGTAALLQWQLPTAENPDGWNGERLFQAARFVTEMEYQHLVFEEFARKVQPAVRPFHVYSPDINPAVKAEFAHAVYRFGHSMLDDDVARTNINGSDNSVPLLTAFLNPPEFFNGGSAGTLTPEQAAGSIVMGSSDQVGNELDEFVTETLRNNLLGLPLDLPTINMTRARSEGIPRLNDLRRQIFAQTNDGQMTPYTDWSDFGQHLKHPESLINFVAAYGTHPDITSATTIVAKRNAARAIVNPIAGDVPPPDAADFMFGTGAYANVGGKTVTGVDDIDLWVGGLSEVTNLGGGLLGSTFNYVFQNQLETLQDGDRFYYLNRTAGMNLRTQLEGNSFAELIQRNTDGTNTLKADAFATADCKFQLGQLTFPAGVGSFITGAGSVADDLATPDCNENRLLLHKTDGTIQYRQFNSVNPSGINGQSVYNGTPGVDRIFGGNDNDTFWGGAGNDIIEGNGGDDVSLGGDGNDIITDLSGADVLKGGPGNDALDGGLGNDIVLGGDGQDFINGGANDNESFAGPGNDFIIAGQGADAVFGNGGDDWIQGGSGQDLLQGDHGAPFFDDPAQAAPGNDILIGQPGENDYDAEGGDDIMSQNAAIDRNAGAAGFDWAIHQYDTVGADDDMEINNNLVGVPIQVVVNRDRWQETEADSGSAFNDVIKGTSVAPASIGGAGFTGCDALDPTGVARIKGLDALVTTFPTPLAPIVASSAAKYCPLTGSGSTVNGEGTVWGEGDILLGGGGSDQITGRGANDIIDGDRSLRVRISVRANDDGTGAEIATFDTMEGVQPFIFNGTYSPGQLVAVREIGTTDVAATDVDTAVFRSARSNYTITNNADGSTTVTDNGAAGKLNDGTDTLWNVEMLQFTDVTIPVGGITGGGSTAPATGTPSITGTPQVGVTLTATNGSITDIDGISLVSFAWEVEGPVGTWTQVGTGSSFTPGPAQATHALRVVATVLDTVGGVTTGLTSDPTAAVAAGVVIGGNNAASGTPIILDRAGLPLAGRPRIGDPLGVDTAAITDPDGIVGVVFHFQWQHSTGGAFTDIPGATDQTYTPTAANLGELLQVRVFFTDQLGSLESLLSAQTRDVRPARTKVAATLVLGRATLPGAINATTITARGVSLTLTAPKTTTIVRVRVFRATATRATATVFINVKPGTHKINLRQAAITRALKHGGVFRIEMTPGTNKTHLGRSTVRHINVRTK